MPEWSLQSSSTRQEIKRVAMFDFSRLQILATVWIGGLVFLLGVSLDILSNYQALDYLQLHWITAYQFLESGKTHTVLILVGVGMLGFAILKLAQQPPSQNQSANRDPAVPPPTITQKQEMNNSGNPTVNVYTAPHPTQSQLPSKAEEKTEDSPVSLQFVEARAARVYRDEYGRWVESDTSQCAALVADFHNPLSGRGQTNFIGEGISAHLTYRNRSGKKLSVRGNWIKEHLQVVTFYPGTTHSILIAVRGKSGGPPCVMDNPNESWAGIPYTRRGTIQLLESLEWPEPTTIPSDCSEVEITLVAGERRLTIFHEVFDFSCGNDGAMELAKRPNGGS
jgi:hypothetical protein